MSLMSPKVCQSWQRFVPLLEKVELLFGQFIRFPYLIICPGWHFKEICFYWDHRTETKIWKKVYLWKVFVFILFAKDSRLGVLPKRYVYDRCTNMTDLPMYMIDVNYSDKYQGYAMKFIINFFFIIIVEIKGKKIYTYEMWLYWWFALNIFKDTLTFNYCQILLHDIAIHYFSNIFHID